MQTVQGKRRRASNEWKDVCCKVHRKVVSTYKNQRLFVRPATFRDLEAGPLEPRDQRAQPTFASLKLLFGLLRSQPALLLLRHALHPSQSLLSFARPPFPSQLPALLRLPMVYLYLRFAGPL